MCPPLLLLLLRLFILNTPHADNPTCKHPVDPLRDCFIMLHKRPSLVGNSPFATSQLLWQHLLSDSVCVQSSDAGREYITVCKWHRSHTDVAIVCTVSPALYSVCTAGNYAPLLLSHEYLKKQKKKKIQILSCFPGSGMQQGRFPGRHRQCILTFTTFSQLIKQE